ncbi:MAG: hypothetical protein ACJATV_000475 [Granulosicoccus sp.]|jgi:hypothetical protein
MRSCELVAKCLHSLEDGFCYIAWIFYSQMVFKRDANCFLSSLGKPEQLM